MTTTQATYPPPLDQIEAEARAAADKYETVNDACPYSFYTEAGRTYKRAFQQERLAINMKRVQEAELDEKARELARNKRGRLVLDMSKQRRPEVAKRAMELVDSRPDLSIEDCKALAKAEVTGLKVEGGAACAS